MPCIKCKLVDKFYPNEKTVSPCETCRNLPVECEDCIKKKDSNAKNTRVTRIAIIAIRVARRLETKAEKNIINA